MATLGMLDETRTRVPVVAVGASAGGITALQKLFGGLPPSVPFALVVLQHLPPGHPSALAELIGRWTSLPVRPAADGTRPEANCVYVPSPACILTLEDGTFRTRPAEGGNRRPGIDTIDAFLESLALQREPRPAAVILSGTGMDGTAGAICLRQAGGVVIVQDPLTAMHDGMPSAVIQRGLHDHVLPAGAIGRQLIACTDARYVRPEPSADWTGDAVHTLSRIVRRIQHRAGFDLSGYKPSPILWRIQQRMEKRKVWSFDDYAALIEDDPVELEALVRGIPIHTTEFFRDAQAWDVLRDEVLSPLLHARSGRDPLRVWTPACSTGEEAYSLAILLDEAARHSGGAADFQLFATDAAPEIVAQASRGMFREESLARMPAERRERYFYEVDGAYRVRRSLRERMVFVPHDLVSESPFSGLHLVTCRNLLIYLKPSTIAHVLALLHRSLRDGGCLFLGRSEPYQLERRGFAIVSRPWNIYRKVGPMPDEPRTLAASKPLPIADAPDFTALRVAVEQTDVPSVLIDEHGTVLRVYGDNAGILRLPPGEPTLDLAELVPRQWSGLLRLSVQKVLASREALTMTRLFERSTGTASMAVRLKPLEGAARGACDRVLVSFYSNADASAKADPHAAKDLNDAHDAHDVARQPCDRAVSDPTDWQDAARVSREELEASREELQALNEELIASNDQLNQSNGHLSEANDRLQENLAQLAMQSRVLLSGAVMTLFLDRDLKLRWFTPTMRDVLPLVQRDVGRSVTDLVPKFNDRDFFTDIRHVIESSEVREAVVAAEDGKVLLRKTYPYVAENGGVAGVAITYADITDRTRAEEVLRRATRDCARRWKPSGRR